MAGTNTLQDLIDNPDHAIAFWNWISQDEFDQFLSIVHDILLDQNREILAKHLHIGEEAAAVRLGELSLIHSLRKTFPRKAEDLVSPVALDIEDNPNQ